MRLDVSEIAEAVRARLAPLGAELDFAPDYDFRDLGRAPRVCVVPSGEGFSLLGRGMVEDTASVDVGFLSRAKPSEMTELVGTVRDTARGLLGMTVGDAVCVKAEHDPLYSVEHLRERNQFTSVIRLTFKWVSRHGNGVQG